MSSAVPRKTPKKADCCCQFIKYSFYRRRGLCLRENLLLLSGLCCIVEKSRILSAVTGFGAKTGFPHAEPVSLRAVVRLRV